jgi:hypothetical protein
LEKSYVGFEQIKNDDAGVASVLGVPAATVSQIEKAQRVLKYENFRNGLLL